MCSCMCLYANTYVFVHVRICILIFEWADFGTFKVKVNWGGHIYKETDGQEIKRLYIQTYVVREMSIKRGAFQD